MIQSILNIASRLFPDYNAKTLKKLEGQLRQIQKFELSMKDIDHDGILEKTRSFKERIANWEQVDNVLLEALAVAKLWCIRLKEMWHEYHKWSEIIKWNMVPYDVQLMWAIILHEGKISEMKTWEWKTLVAALSLYVNALAWRWAHLVTANEYLAKRDANEMWQLYKFLWLNVGVTYTWQPREDKIASYACDITYWTNNEFGFDYLRDNMAPTKEAICQRELYYVIVDEVDSILVDEARTPLIISSPAEEGTEKYMEYSKLVSYLTPVEHYITDEKSRSVILTEKWIAKMESLLWVDNIYTAKWFAEVHHIEQALKAQFLYRLDKDYIVKDNKVIIVDEFTWRLMDWRRFWWWLHQALEAKEWVMVQRESRTLASITFQNFFRLYKRLAWMTWTAITEAEEFASIYWLDTIVVPTNRPMIRKDNSDVIYKSARWKYQAIVAKIKELNSKGQPVLIWTVSVEKSEILSSLFKQAWISHTVLNAKYHEREAEIIAMAWQKGAVTIATNMAWRWTDIRLWEWVEEIWWLFILGSERHESRRIDNQLRWRSWRQWDKWASQFFISMDDDLMRIFGSDRMKSIMEALRVPEDMPIENVMVSKSIEWAQKKVEQHNFDIRKHIVQFDDVMNKHREIVYKRRREILFSTDVSDRVREEMFKLANHIVLSHTDWIPVHEWDYQSMYSLIKAVSSEGLFEFETWYRDWANKDILLSMVNQFFEDKYAEKVKSFPTLEMFKHVERSIYLQSIDMLWMEHIDAMQRIRESVALSGYWQRDPLLEYKHQSFEAIKILLSDISKNTISMLFRVKLRLNVTIPESEPRVRVVTNEQQIESNITSNQIVKDVEEIKVEEAQGSIKKKEAEEFAKIFNPNNFPRQVIRVGANEQPKAETVTTIWRNDPCNCWSWKKYKKCCYR